MGCLLLLSVCWLPSHRHKASAGVAAALFPDFQHVTERVLLLQRNQQHQCCQRQLELRQLSVRPHGPLLLLPEGHLPFHFSQHPSNSLPSYVKKRAFVRLNSLNFHPLMYPRGSASLSELCYVQDLKQKDRMPEKGIFRMHCCLVRRPRPEPSVLLKSGLLVHMKQ